jgi:hypothetical protein
MARWASTGLGMCYPFVDKEGQIAIGIFATYVLFTGDVPQLADVFGEFPQGADHPSASEVRRSPVLHGLLKSTHDRTGFWPLRWCNDHQVND